jgi:hypothetical protein
MAFITADRISDTTTTAGTGNIIVTGVPPVGYAALSSVLSVSDTFYYCIQSQTTAEWETGVGTYISANIFSRTTTLASSNSGNLVNFSDGVKTVFMTLAAAKTLQTTPGTVGASAVNAVATNATASRIFADYLADTINVKDFGAVGDGETDDTAALQAAINAACTTGAPLNLGSGLNTYKITSGLIAKPQIFSATATIPQFSSGVPFVLIGNGNARVVAGAAMTNMLTIIYNNALPPTGTLAPYFSKIEGIYFDGNNLATTCVQSNYAGYLSVSRSRFYKATIGIEWIGVGVAHVVENAFYCNTGVKLNDGGGDSLFSHNDFFFVAAGDSGLYLNGYAGNTDIFANIFNIESINGTCYAVNVDNTTNPTHEGRHVRVLSNEFYGCVGVKILGPSTSSRLVYEYTIAFNHTLNSFSGGTPQQSGVLVDAKYATNLTISENFAGTYFTASNNVAQITLDSCSYCQISTNTVMKAVTTAVNLINCLHTQINGNKFINNGTSGTGNKIVVLDGSYNTQIVSNFVVQESASYAQTFVYEQNGASLTYYTDNVCDGNVTTPFAPVAGNSVNATNLFSTTSTASKITAAGIAANLDLTLTPKGTGKVQFGTAASSATTPATFSATKYITIKDSTGATFYVPASSTTW